MEQMIRGRATNLSPVERWASAVGGSLLLIRSFERGRDGWLTALLGADLIRRGATGQCYFYRALGLTTAPRDHQRVSIPYRQGIRIDDSVAIDRPAEELYTYWRQLENLPRFMRHLVSVTPLDEMRSRWVAKAPAGREVEWEAEIINDIPNERIGWRSLPGSEVDSAGSVQFKRLAGDRGTIVSVELQYIPPGGIIAALAAKLSGEEPHRQVREDLRRFKQIMEAGEVPATQRAPHDAWERIRKEPGRLIDDFSPKAAPG